MLRRLAPLLLLLATALPLPAVQPDEVLADPALESRARDLSRELRCPVCQGENIDDSGAAVARDLRLLVRERLMAGDTDSQVLDYIAARYGEYVLFSPRGRGANLILYATGPVVLLIALGGVLIWFRRRTAAQPTPLSAEEEARLRRIMAEPDPITPSGAPRSPR
ncbi:cytochrome c-type biogenesis protein [Paenirhodobacter populi]|uniref:Cytochrome c-type biogenesis protein n=1 Tax=Paenirhodobacter populi TaxID=2306993 RepID=A0A443JT61_9RHOB|nr:cytochrome c-type biogenesis protein [Sinirhodobacter populi]RWR23700.1 cytochrome c-type biogenesis protein CcmH [Sinirhodobacter populi]